MKKIKLFRKIRIEEIMLLLIFMFISVVALYLGVYSVSMYNMKKASYGLYTPNAMAFKVRDLDNAPDIILEYIKTVDNVAFMQKGFNELMLAYTDGGYSIPPVIDGRFITQEDISSEAKVAVLGVDFGVNNSGKIQVYRKDGLPVLSYGGVEYEIIGTVAFGYPSPVNTSFYRSFTPQSISTGGAYIIDSPDKKIIKNTYSVIKTMVEQNGGKFVEIDLPQSQVNITQFFQVDLLNLVMMAFAIFTTILATVPITLYWSNRRHKDMAVKRFLGFSTGRIVWQIYRRFLILLLLGFLLGYGSFWILVPLKIMIPPSLFSLQTGVAFLLALLFNVLTALVPVVESMRIDPGDVLRRDG